MVDFAQVNSRIVSVIEALDPKIAEVAICHLRDAMSAIEAIGQGSAPEYALHDKLIRGQVSPRATILPQGHGVPFK